MKKPLVISAVAAILLVATAAWLVHLRDAPRQVPSADVDVLSEQRVQRAIELGVAWFARSQRPNGQFFYEYDALHDRYEPKSYNLLRHAGSLYSLCQAYRRWPRSERAGTIRQAASWLLAQSRAVEDPGAPTRRYFYFHGRSKLGGEGLGLLALTECRAATGDQRWDQPIEELARFLLSRLRPDGTFLQYFDPTGAPESKRESLYYPGEAVLGLIQYFEQSQRPPALVEPISRALAAIEARNRGTGPLTDAWRVMAIARWLELTGERAQVPYAGRVLDTMAAQQERDPKAGEAYGAFVRDGVPQTIPTGSRNEAFTAAWRVAERAGWDRAWLEGVALASARYQLSQQFFSQAQAASLPAFERAQGGFRDSPSDDNTRIDGVQHNISALMGVLDILAERRRCAAPALNARDLAAFEAALPRPPC